MQRRAARQVRTKGIRYRVLLGIFVTSHYPFALLSQRELRLTLVGKNSPASVIARAILSSKAIAKRWRNPRERAGPTSASGAALRSPSALCVAVVYRIAL